MFQWEWGNLFGMVDLFDYFWIRGYSCFYTPLNRPTGSKPLGFVMRQETAEEEQAGLFSVEKQTTTESQLQQVILHYV